MQIIHLRCSSCQFESIDKRRFDTHTIGKTQEHPSKYSLFICSFCSAAATSKSIIEEHTQIYHPLANKINIEERLQPYFMEPDEPLTMKPRLECPLCRNPQNEMTSFADHLATEHSIPFPLISSYLKQHLQQQIQQSRMTNFPQHQQGHQEPPTDSSTNSSTSSSLCSPPSAFLNRNRASDNEFILQSNADEVNSDKSTGSENKGLGMNTKFPNLPTENLHSSQMSKMSSTELLKLITSSFRVGEESSMMNKLRELQKPFSRLPTNPIDNFPPRSLPDWTQSSRLPIPAGLKPTAPPPGASPEMLNNLMSHFLGSNRSQSMLMNSESANQIFRMAATNQVSTSGVMESANRTPAIYSPENKRKRVEGFSFKPFKIEETRDNWQFEDQGVSSAKKRTTVSVVTTPSVAVHNTLRKTKSDMKVIQRYFVQIKHDQRDLQDISPEDLDSYMQDFIVSAKKKDGNEYEPESLKAFVHSLERHLKYQNYPYSVLKDSMFQGTRSILNKRLVELRNQTRPNPTQQTSLEVENHNDNGSGDVLVDTSLHCDFPKAPTGAELLRDNLLGHENPQAILNSLWLMNRTQFNIGGSQRHKALFWGQFQLITGIDGARVIQFTPLEAGATQNSKEVRYCRGHGGSGNNTAMGTGNPATQMNKILSAQNQPISCTGTGKRLPMPFNCVEILEIYASMRPLDCRGASDPFYLVPEVNLEHGGSWFKPCALSAQFISRIPRLLGLKPMKELPQSCTSSNQSGGDAESYENEISPDNDASSFIAEQKEKARKLMSVLLAQNQSLFSNIVPPSIESLSDTAQNYFKSLTNVFRNSTENNNGPIKLSSLENSEKNDGDLENGNSKQNCEDYHQNHSNMEALSDSTSSSRPISREMVLNVSSSSPHNEIISSKQPNEHLQASLSAI